VNERNYWKKKLSEYAEEDWSKDPSIFAEQVIDYFPLKGKLLELAGGRGNDSRYFAGEGYEVTYSDFVEEVVSEVEDTTDESLGISYMKIDLQESLPFADSTFEIVYSHMGLHYFGRKETQRVIREIHRVLKGRGTLAMLLNTLDDPEIREHNYQEIEPHFFEDPRSGLRKSYFSVEYLKELAEDFFEPLILDNQGETYKDEVKSLVRFVGERK